MNPKKEETFFLDTDSKSEECRIITSIFSESRNKYYLVYEYVRPCEDIFVSSYDPNDESCTLKDIKEEELEEISKYLSEMMEEIK